MWAFGSGARGPHRQLYYIQRECGSLFLVFFFSLQVERKDLQVSPNSSRPSVLWESPSFLQVESIGSWILEAFPLGHCLFTHIY